MKARITHTLSVASLLLALLPAASQAANLVDTFRYTQKNDPQWAARKAKFLADKEQATQAMSSMRPNVQAGAKWARQQTDAPSGNVDAAAGQDCANAVTNLNQVTDLSDPTSAARIAGLSSCGTWFGDVVNALSTTERKNNNLTQYQVTAIQPLLRLDRLYGANSAQALLAAAQADLGNAQQDLMLRTSEAYFNLLKTQEDLRLAQSEERTLKTALAEVKNRFRVGLGRDTDVFETQAHYDLASAAVIVADSEMQSAREMLVLMTNQQELLIDPLPRDVPIESPKPVDVSEWEETAKRNNLTLLASRFVVNARKEEIAGRRAGHAPTIDLVADYSKSMYGGDSSTSNQTNTVGLNLTVPIYSGGITSSQERQARHQAIEAEDNADLAMRNALRETRQYHSRVNADVQAVKARAAAIRSSASAYRSMKLGYENGVRTLTDVLQSQRTLFQARKDYANSRYLYIIDTLRLKKSAGVLTESDLEAVNSWLAASTPAPLEPDELGGMTMQEIDGIRLNGDTKAYSDDRKTSHKSLYDAFKAWKQDKR